MNHKQMSGKLLVFMVQRDKGEIVFLWLSIEFALYLNGLLTVKLVNFPFNLVKI